MHFRNVHFSNNYAILRNIGFGMPLNSLNHLERHIKSFEMVLFEIYRDTA